MIKHKLIILFSAFLRTKSIAKLNYNRISYEVNKDIKMPNKSVEFYENTMREHFKKNLHHDLLKRAERINKNISIVEISSAQSFSDLSKSSGLPIKIIDDLIIDAVNILMREYRQDTGVPPQTIWGRMFHSHENAHAQKAIAMEVVCACDKAKFLGTKEEDINNIKKFLEQGLLATDLHPQDNFLNVVKAIANQTDGIMRWELSTDAKERLSYPETVTLKK
jgi:hypothetical protein